MPTLVVPLGADASGMQAGLETWVDSYFRTAYTEAQQVPVLGLLAASTSVTGTDPFGTPDTTSYVTADGPAFKAGLPAGAPYRDTSSSSGSGRILIGGRQTTAVGFPGDAFNITAQLVVVLRDTYGESFDLVFRGRDDAGTVLLSTVQIDYFTQATFTEYRMTLPDSRSAWITALAQRQVYAYVNTGTFYTDGVLDVAYIGVELTYDLPEPLPPPPPGAVLAAASRVRPSLRQLQRGGRGGIGGVPRLIGNPTVQDSPRRGPGTVI